MAWPPQTARPPQTAPHYANYAVTTPTIVTGKQIVSVSFIKSLLSLGRSAGIPPLPYPGPDPAREDFPRAEGRLSPGPGNLKGPARQAEPASLREAGRGAHASPRPCLGLARQPQTRPNRFARTSLEQRAGSAGRAGPLREAAGQGGTRQLTHSCPNPRCLIIPMFNVCCRSGW